ncbi:MAG: OmpA family protein [Motiliproteus sp.]
MKTIATIALLSATLTTTILPAQAADHDRLLSEREAPQQAKQKQLKGIGIGALLGTLLAGPVGTIAGSGIGSIAGWGEGMEDAYQSEKQATTKKHEDLERSQRELNSNRQSLQQSKSNISQLQQLLQSLLLDIHFQTNSAVVEPHYYPRLQQLASKLNNLDGLHLRLTGFADHRGSDPYNQTLAKARVNALTALLVDHGLDPQRICTEVLGESTALSRQHNGLLPFDRRVEIRFLLDSQKQQ